MIKQARQKAALEFSARAGMGTAIVSPGPRIGLSVVELRAVWPFADLWNKFSFFKTYYSKFTSIF